MIIAHIYPKNMWTWAEKNITELSDLGEEKLRNLTNWAN